MKQSIKMNHPNAGGFILVPCSAVANMEHQGWRVADDQGADEAPDQTESTQTEEIDNG